MNADTAEQIEALAQAAATKDTVRRELTEYGFQFGAALVERCMETGRGGVVVTVKTPKCTLDVYVTKTGKVRLWMGGFEVLTTR